MVLRKKQIVCVAILMVMFFLTWSTPLIAASVHTVKPGESLYAVSKRYGTTVALLKSENGLKKDTIYPGQKLRIPGNNTVSRSKGLSIGEEDLYWLARAVYGEARGEPFEGQVAVAAVILNRLRSPQFPDTIKGVIFEPLAFTAVADGQIYYTPNATAIKAARTAINGPDPSGGALYYWNPAKATSKWIWSRPIIKKIGNHVFAK